MNLVSESKKIVERHQKRKQDMEVVSQILGIDIAFSEEEIEKFITEDIEKYLAKKFMESVTFG